MKQRLPFFYYTEKKRKQEGKGEDEGKKKALQEGIPQGPEI